MLRKKSRTDVTRDGAGRAAAAAPPQAAQPAGGSAGLKEWASGGARKAGMGLRGSLHQVAPYTLAAPATISCAPESRGHGVGAGAPGMQHAHQDGRPRTVTEVC